MLAAIVAVLSPLRDILSRDPLAAISPRRRARAPLAPRWQTGAARRPGVSGCGHGDPVLRAATRRFPAMVLLIAALLLVLPLVLSRRSRSSGGLRARSRARCRTSRRWSWAPARARAVAISATGAIAVFGSVAIQGAHGDLLAGLEDAARRTERVHGRVGAPAGAYNLLDTPRSRRPSKPSSNACQGCGRCASTAAGCWTMASAACS